jgi:Ca2+-binding EF-hand superfamily protein
MTQRGTKSAVACAVLGLSVSMPAWAQQAAAGPHGGQGGPERAAAMAAHLFERMDTNGDGKVTREEADETGKRLFEKFDRNADGAVTRDEADAGAKALRQEELVVRFKKLDQDGDGKLSGTESQLPPQFFQKLDTNNDRALSLEEFQARPDRRAEHREFEFERADGNHDGKVTRAEADQSAKERFDHVDADHDGVITRAEFDAHVANMAAMASANAKTHTTK